MDVHLTPAGGVGCLATVLSFGVAARVQKKQEAQFPARLDEEAMQLRDGRRIRWADMSRLRATDVIVAGRRMHTLYEIWHRSGRVRILSSRIANMAEVIDFITRHLPPGTPLR
jgi:Flp pilus assembly protein TadB